MSGIEKQFADYYSRLEEQWAKRGKDLRQFDEYEQETIALKQFNSDYGANGLPDYFAWHGLSMREPLLRGLRRIGAQRLETIVRECFALLEKHGFDPEADDVYEFIEGCPEEVQDEFDSRQAEASDLYEDFYERWETGFARQMAKGKSADTWAP